MGITQRIRNLIRLPAWELAATILDLEDELQSIMDAKTAPIHFSRNAANEGALQVDVEADKDARITRGPENQEMWERELGNCLGVRLMFSNWTPPTELGVFDREGVFLDLDGVVKPFTIRFWVTPSN